MDFDEALRVVRSQTIPALRGSGGDGHAEAIERVLLELKRLEHDCETLRRLGVQAEARLLRVVDLAESEIRAHSETYPQLGLSLERILAAAKEKPYRCECGDTDPRHHHCGVMGWDPTRDARCPGCAPSEAKR